MDTVAIVMGLATGILWIGIIPWMWGYFLSIPILATIGLVFSKYIFLSYCVLTIVLVNISLFSCFYSEYRKQSRINFGQLKFSDFYLLQHKGVFESGVIEGLNKLFKIFGMSVKKKDN